MTLAKLRIWPKKHRKPRAKLHRQWPLVQTPCCGIYTRALQNIAKQLLMTILPSKNPARGVGLPTRLTRSIKGWCSSTTDRLSGPFTVGGKGSMLGYILNAAFISRLRGVERKKLLCSCIGGWVASRVWSRFVVVVLGQLSWKQQWKLSLGYNKCIPYILH